MIKPVELAALHAGMGGNKIIYIAVQKPKDGLKLLASAHDTTDDFALSVSNGAAWIDFELDFENAETLARWIIESVEYRRSDEGQAEQQRELARMNSYADKLAASREASRPSDG